MSRARSVLIAMAAGCAVSLGGAASALAGSAPTPLGLSCVPSGGAQFCEGKVPTTAAEVGGPNDTRVRVDGAPLDVNVALPSGTARNTPLVVLMHGWGGKKSGADEMTGWARRGYSVLSYTARGWFGSCGKLNSTTNLLAIDPAGCAKGYTHLADARYEIRDTQNLVGLLVDAGFANPAKIGFTGGSYGGGQSVMLAVLGQQQMRPDGKLLQWFSPGGTPIQPAAAAPFIPWTDLGYSLVPNGATLDYAIRPLTADLAPLGIQKQSFVGGLYAVTGNGANLAPPGTDPAADLTRWNSLFNRGEPYGKAAAAAGRELATYHSGYGILDKVIKAGPPVGLTSAPPIPTLIINGWTDDLFPADEATRWVNRMRQKYPKVPVKQMFLDVGHMRGQNKPGDTARWQAAVRAWFDYYVKGGAPKPAANVTAMTQTCPKTAPSGGPFVARTWAALHPGEIRVRTGKAQTLRSTGGSEAVSKVVDPVFGGGACATTPSRNLPATATYRRAVGSRAFTLLGSPTVIAQFDVTGRYPEIAARLWDVSGATQTLVDRALYRPAAHGRQVFQLHANGWRFAPGHTVKLELLGRDAPYGRASNGTFSIRVSNLEVRLPVRERPGALGGRVTKPAPVVLPKGAVKAP